ncbi:uncharacterized protein [Macrobrachium rosenbergii]|uniref:uncharacterized protein n=1 Tax=Macrobrachium rosenbergii TaxID=79674 RepID=UPI0034D4EA7D
MDLEIRNTVKGRPAHVPLTVKEWNLTQEEEARQEFKERVLREVRLLEGVQEWWNHSSMAIKRVGGDVFGRTSGKKPPDDKETWWWNDEVKEVVKAKKKMQKKIWEKYGLQEDNERYQRHKKEVKKAVAQEKRCGEAWEKKE